MKWILIYVITTLHLQGGIKAVSVTTQEAESKAGCERVAKEIAVALAAADVMSRVETKHSCVRK